MNPAPMARRRAPRLVIDPAAAGENFRALAAHCAPAEAAAVVKADAYGLGAHRMAPALAAAGARTFFVASPREGAALRRILRETGFPDAAVYALHGLEGLRPSALRRQAITPVLSERRELESWLGAPSAPFALQFDTGMNRLGFSAADAKALAALCADAQRPPALIVSHFARADTPQAEANAAQIERFAAIRAQFPGVPASLANSAAGLALPAAHGDLVRFGLALYGGDALSEGPTRPKLRPAAQVLAPILQRRRVPAGTAIGYGASFRAPHALETAIVALGYADGFLRAASGKGYGWLAGRKAPVLGRISMDLTVIDVSACARDANPGVEVEFLGAQVSLADAAEAAGTIPYEILTGFGAQCRRVYRSLL